MKLFYLSSLVAVLICGCSGQGGNPENGQAIREAAGADRGKSDARAIVYGVDHTPPRNYESSVLNEADKFSTNQVRVNGSGYGFKR